MAHEAHALHEMMGAYRLGDLVRPQAGRAADLTRVAGTGPATTAAADSTNGQPALHTGRRGSAPRSHASGSAQVAAAAADGDGEWQEF
jgi:hypothetical protein